MSIQRKGSPHCCAHTTRPPSLAGSPAEQTAETLHPHTEQARGAQPPPTGACTPGLTHFLIPTPQLAHTPRCHVYGNFFAQEELRVYTMQCLLYTSNGKEKRVAEISPVLYSQDFLKD